MPRSRRGFQLQQFLPGGITPSSSASPTGVIQKAPGVGAAAQSAPFSAPAPKPILAQGIQSSPLAAQPAAPTQSKFADLQKALGGISMGVSGNLLGGGSPQFASSLLGADAGSTDWSKIFSNAMYGQSGSAISAALKNLGITKPQVTLGGVGANSYGTDWMKKMGLV